MNIFIRNEKHFEPVIDGKLILTIGVSPGIIVEEENKTAIVSFSNDELVRIKKWINEVCHV